MSTEIPPVEGAVSPIEPPSPNNGVTGGSENYSLSERVIADPGRKIVSKKLSLVLLLSSIIGGIGGALLLGHILEHVARVIFQLEDLNLTSILINGSILVLLGAIGTFTLVAAFWVQNKKYRFWIIFFSMPLPLVIELIDLPLRFWGIINDATIFYGLVF